MQQGSQIDPEKLEVGDRIRRKVGHCYTYLLVQRIEKSGAVVSHKCGAHMHIKEWKELVSNYELI